MLVFVGADTLVAVEDIPQQHIEAFLQLRSLVERLSIDLERLILNPGVN
jgi:hypothetical protein